MSTVNFTAKLVDNQTIQRRNSLFGYGNQEVSIVELECANKNDMEALNHVSSKWTKKGAHYVNEILDRAVYDNHNSPIEKDHFYALTTQTHNFEQLKSDNILGMMMFFERIDPVNEISLLEVNPDISKRKHFFRKYKHVGKKLVEFVQATFPHKDIEVWSDYCARGFYKKLGFENRTKEACDLLWSALK